MIAYLRWSTGPWSMGEPKMNALNLREIPNSDKVYNIESFSSITKVSPDNILMVNTDLFYTVDGTEYINKLIKENRVSRSRKK